MDAKHFDRLARALGASQPRRGLLGWLLFLLSGLLASLPSTAVDGKGRRKRRKKPHHHQKRKRQAERRRKQRRKCRAKPRAVTCAGRCGIVRDKCKKRVDCGSCACDPPCPVCQTCDALAVACAPDPAQQGQPCGAAGQVCQPNGTCACVPATCAAQACGPTPDVCGGTHECGPCPECQRCEAGLCQPDPVPVGEPCDVCRCEAGAICDSGICQPCDVLFDGDSVTSGETLQEHLTTGGAIRVCPGRYQHNFVLSANVTLLGAGDGEDEATSTILDAGGSGSTLVGNVGVTASMQGVRITGGNERLGGGIFSDGRLTLTACTVSDNDAELGGGIYTSFAGIGQLALIDCRVTENRASRHGGGIHNNNISTTRLSGCTFSENRSTEDGGGIYNNGGSFEITGSVISGNEAQGNGGGVNNASPVATNPGEVTFDAASRITNNTAGTGGGIFNGGIVTLGGAAVTDNEPNNCAGNPVDGCVEDP